MLTINTITFITSVLSALVIVSSTLFVLYKDPKSQVNRYYTFFSMSGLGIVLGMLFLYGFPDSGNLLLYSRFLQVSTIMFFASYLTLSYVFPKPDRKVRLYPVLLQLIPVMCTSIIILFTDFNMSEVRWEKGVLYRKYGFFYNYYFAIGLVYFAAGTINFVRRYIKTDVYVYRLQMRYFFSGIFIGISFTTVFSLVLPRFFNYTLFYGLSPTFTTIITIGALFYTIVAYNLLDIATVIHKTIMYSIISAAIFIPMLAIIFLFNRKSPWISMLPEEVMVLILVIAFILFSTFIQPLIDRAFKRRQYAFENVVDDFIRHVGSVRETSRIIRESVYILVKSLSLQKSVFLMYNNDSRHYEPVHASSGTDLSAIEPLDRNSTLVRWFARNPDILTRGRIYTDDLNFGAIREDMTSFYSKNDFRLVIPLYHERRLIALICLGEKESLVGYTPDELEKLSFFQRECNEMLSTSLLYEEGMRKQMVSRTRDLSSYIQSHSIPTFLPNFEDIRFGGFIIPRFSEGADYFDFIRLGNQGIGMVVTDMQGYGVPQSLYSVVIRAAFQSCISDAPSSYNVIKSMNHVLCDYTGGKGEGVSAFYAFYDVKSSRLMYTNAGYQPLDVFRMETRVFDSFDTEGVALGRKKDANYGIGRTNLMKGDIGLLYSRSLITSRSQNGEEFGVMRIRSIVRDHRNNHPSEIARLIQESFERFMGISTPVSDVLLLVFKVV